jgi:hypothetical protein
MPNVVDSLLYVSTIAQFREDGGFHRVGEQEGCLAFGYFFVCGLQLSPMDFGIYRQ